MEPRGQESGEITLTSAPKFLLQGISSTDKDPVSIAMQSMIYLRKNHWFQQQYVHKATFLTPDIWSTSRMHSIPHLLVLTWMFSHCLWWIWCMSLSWVSLRTSWSIFCDFYKPVVLKPLLNLTGGKFQSIQSNQFYSYYYIPQFQAGSYIWPWHYPEVCQWCLWLEAACSTRFWGHFAGVCLNYCWCSSHW